jgi:hypothetical protein
LNPRKIAKCGFVNSDVNKITHLNFCGDEVAAGKQYKKIKVAHMGDCVFKQIQSITGEGGGQIAQTEFAAKYLDPAKFVILSRKLLYVKGLEILASLMKTY